MARTKKERTPESIAHDLYGWLQHACFDYAGGDEAQAEEMFNDAGALGDVLGDRVYDEARGEEELMLAIWIALWEIGNSCNAALAAAANNHFNR